MVCSQNLSPTMTKKLASFVTMVTATRIKKDRDKQIYDKLLTLIGFILITLENNTHFDQNI